jgi:hypothetical protein
MKHKNLKCRIGISIFLILMVVNVTSCGKQSPIIGGETPFVVESIKKYDDTHSEYYSVSIGSGNFVSGLEGKPMIILPTGMYQINDTIDVDFNKR